MIEIKGVSKSFGNNIVLNDLNLTINKGSIFGLVGINGAGKSTLLRLISGVYQSDCGLITINNEKIYDNKNVKKKVFFLPDEPYYSYRVTANDLSNLYRSYYDFNDEIFNYHLDTFKLSSKKPLQNFSKGMKRQVFISLALACQPEYILLDEAFDGLDPLARLHFKRTIIDMSSNQDVTIIISSHSLRELEDICDSYGIIDHNEVISQGSITDSIALINKYQFATNKPLTKELIKSVEVKSFSVEGKLMKITFKGDKDKFIEEIEKYDLLFIDEIEVSFEDLFIEEVESRGYLK